MRGLVRTFFFPTWIFCHTCSFVLAITLESVPLVIVQAVLSVKVGFGPGPLESCYRQIGGQFVVFVLTLNLWTYFTQQVLVWHSKIKSPQRNFYFCNFWLKVMVKNTWVLKSQQYLTILWCTSINMMNRYVCALRDTG